MATQFRCERRSGRENGRACLRRHYRVAKFLEWRRSRRYSNSGCRSVRTLPRRRAKRKRYESPSSSSSSNIALTMSSSHLQSPLSTTRSSPLPQPPPTTMSSSPLPQPPTTTSSSPSRRLRAPTLFPQQLPASQNLEPMKKYSKQEPKESLLKQFKTPTTA